MRFSRSVVRSARRVSAVAAGLLVLVLTASLCRLTPASADRIPDSMTRAAPVGGVAHPDRSGDADLRQGWLAPTSQQLQRVRALDAKARWTRFGTLSALTRAGRALAIGRPGTPEAVARQFVHAHRLLFRMSARHVRALELLSSVPLADTGTDTRTAGPRAVVFRERYGPLPAGAGGLVTVGVAGQEVAFVSSSAYGDAAVPATPRISAVNAWLRAARATGRDVARNAVGPVDRAADRRDWSSFTVAGMAQVQQARLVAVGLPGTGVRPAYEVNVVDVQDGSASASTSFVDAVSGAVLVRHDRVDHLLRPASPVHAPPPAESAPAPAAPAGANRTGQGCPPGCGFLLPPYGVVGQAFWSGPGEFPWPVDAPAHSEVLAAPPEGEHDNNNAFTVPAWERTPTSTAPIAPTTPRIAAGAAAGSEDWSDPWQRSRCDTGALGDDVRGAVASVFGLHDGLHDWTYRLGFTEPAANLQQDNAGAGGLDHDRQVGYVQTGALTGGYPTYLGRNDANQVTLQDGFPAVAGAYLFEPVAARWHGPCVDGALDPTVVAHEYAHAVTSRMVGGPDLGIASPQGRPVAESWSDLIAAEYLLEYARTGPDASSPTAIGAYVAGNSVRGVRAYRLGTSPLNLTNAAPAGGDRFGLADEVWSAVNWDIRTALADKYATGFPAGDPTLQRACADGQRPVATCPGNRRWIQLLLDSLLLQQSDLSMLDARDALLAADRMRFGGANLVELWRAFAARGLGPGARLAPDGRPVVADFTVPAFLADVRPGRLVVDALARPLGGPAVVSVHIGDFAAGSLPVADTDSRSARLGYVDLAPGRYPVTWSAPAFGMGRATVTIRSGGQHYLRLYLDPNLASAASGARAAAMPAAGDPAAVIDDREDTAWTVERRVPDGRASAVAVDLAGSTPRWVRSVRVSALTDDGFAAVRSFAVEVCTRSRAIRCAVDSPDGWRRLFVSPAAAFPAVRPHPVAPDLAFRDFDVPDARATDVRLVVLQTQCSGNPAYHGEQEADPLSTSDCLASPKVRSAALAELMVYGVDPPRTR